MRSFTAVIEWDPVTRLYVGLVPEVHGAHTAAASLDELNLKLREVIELCLEEMGGEPASANCATG